MVIWVVDMNMILMIIIEGFRRLGDTKWVRCIGLIKLKSLSIVPCDGWMLKYESKEIDPGMVTEMCLLAQKR